MTDKLEAAARRTWVNNECDRLAKRGMRRALARNESLREAARRVGITPARLCDIEAGRTALTPKPPVGQR